jgi:hypothetical protein
MAEDIQRVLQALQARKPQQITSPGLVEQTTSNSNTPILQNPNNPSVPMPEVGGQPTSLGRIPPELLIELINRQDNARVAKERAAPTPGFLESIFK